MENLWNPKPQIDMGPSPLLQAVKQRSFQPIRNAFTVRKIGNMLTNMTNEPTNFIGGGGGAVMGTIAGKTAKGFAKAPNKFSAVWDKMPRFEISDKAAKFTKPLKNTLEEELKKLQTEASPLAHKWFNSTATPIELKRMQLLDQQIPRIENKLKMNKDVSLGNILQHEELYKNYPGMQFTKVNQTSVPALQGRASFNPANNEISMYKGLFDNPNEAKQTLLHEIQHAIQEREGFARGGSPMSGGFEGYLKNSGEVEARSVANRANMSANQRLTTPPYVDQNIPVKDLITHFNSGTQASVSPLMSGQNIPRRTLAEIAMMSPAQKRAAVKRLYELSQFRNSAQQVEQGFANHAQNMQAESIARSKELARQALQQRTQQAFDRAHAGFDITKLFK